MTAERCLGIVCLKDGINDLSRTESVASSAASIASASSASSSLDFVNDSGYSSVSS